MASLFPPNVKTNTASIKDPAQSDEFDIDDALAAHDDPGELDPALEETRRILMDYIALRHKGPIISKADSAPAVAPEVESPNTHNVQR